MKISCEAAGMRTLLIDNYDSFTYNLYQLIAEVAGMPPRVVYNDASLDEVWKYDFDCAVVSPGPGTPAEAKDFGISKNAIADFGVPVLGICLGHQGIGHHFGGRIVHCPEVMHGRVSTVHLGDNELFEGLPARIDVVRYHSLMIDPELPPCLERIAWLADGTVMGVKHADRPLYGIQFHPESVLSQCGHELLANFHRVTRRYWEGLDQGQRLPRQVRKEPVQ
jgi:anthranilate synthase/aminodeoxychorismate synthase-like glutamine amidotransferase